MAFDIKLYRAWAIVLRHTRHMSHSFARLSDIFYWPLVDIVLWGYAGIWVGTGQEHGSALAIVLLTASVLWELVVKVNCGISVNLLEEIWSHNVSNLFCTPLQLAEWIIGTTLVALWIMVCTAVFLGFIVRWFYSFNLLTIGYVLLPIAASLVLSGMVIGFFASALLIYWGYKVDALVFMIGWAFAPISGVYYPIEILPTWLRMFASVLPMPYVFDALRKVIATGEVASRDLSISFVLNIVYLIVTLVFFKYMYEKSRERGLSRLAG
jgi:ABC-2 type transport system permease protein